MLSTSRVALDPRFRGDDAEERAATRSRICQRVTMDRIRTHPGAMLLEEFMKPLGLSANALAEELHVPANRVLAIVKGERAVTADTALRLGRYFGTTAELWVNLQAAYDLSLAKARQGKEIAREVNPRAA